MDDIKGKTIEAKSEQIMSWRTKTEPAIETNRAIETLMEKLRIACQADRGELICELSRALADEVDHAFTHPELWPPERVSAVQGLLQDAAAATLGTPYEENCAARPEEFEIRLQSLLEAREAVEKVRKSR